MIVLGLSFEILNFTTEHDGTKTAAQIRSHAQKFFSKVLRDKSECITNTKESIKIPPPRSKRKPLHPYPRKQPETADSKEISVPKKEMNSNSPEASDFDRENQSPKSVLPTPDCESLGSSDSDTPNGSFSPRSLISCILADPIEACKPIPLDKHVSKGEQKSDRFANSSLCETSAVSQLRVRVRRETCGKGFVPYKRCMSKKEIQSSSATTDER
ncbi:hypothetical protein RYX36_015925 [Vicia faba]